MLFKKNVAPISIEFFKNLHAMVFHEKNTALNTIIVQENNSGLALKVRLNDVL